MFKRVVIVALALGALAALAPQQVDAAPVPPCPGPTEILNLQLYEVTVDGERVLPNGDDYATDAGLVFKVREGNLTAVMGDMGDAGCALPSTMVALDIIDPFTGALQVVTLERTP